MLSFNHRIKQALHHLSHLFIHFAKYFIVNEKSLEFLESIENSFTFFLSFQCQVGVLVGLQVYQQLLQLDRVAVTREHNRCVE
jgi:hypothetical protein